jgi:DNA mismatch repair protein MutL
MTIHILPPDVAAKIAAGEVVERPANVAKELVENSLDAGATEIRVELREGGQRLLRVIDNGCGMTAAEAPLAFLRHATSKLRSVDDLNAIRTFGFRGEALYSIAAVSQVTLTTRHASEAFGSQIRVEENQIIEQGKAGAAPGTIVSIEHLFYNVPARQKFLRKAATEAGQISDVVQRYALAYPERRFSLVTDGRLVFQSTGSGDLFDVLAKLYGLENAKQMVPIGMRNTKYGIRNDGQPDPAEDLPLPLGNLDEDISFMSPDTTTNHTAFRAQHSALRITGYASLPSLTRANRNGIDIFVNQRYVEDRNITYAVVQAYHTLLPVGRYPLAVIMVEIDPSVVDVNVHPQKTHVRFVDDRMLFSAVQKAVRQAVVAHAPVPDLTVNVAVPGLGAATGTPAAWHRPADLPLLPRTDWQPPLEIYTAPSGPARSTATTTPIETSPPNPTDPPPVVPPPIEQKTLLGGRTSQLPPLRVVGQVGALYVITEGPEGLYLIDQHAAHERILYEKLMAQRSTLSSDTEASQQLLQPLPLHVGSGVAGLVAQHLTELTRVGFDIEAFGSDTFLVRAVPSVLAGQDPLRTLEEIVQGLAERRNLVGETSEARLVKLICKRAAIKAGQLLSDLEMQELVRQLEACQSPRTCPHGRPTMIQLSANELEKAFGRI